MLFLIKMTVTLPHELIEEERLVLRTDEAKVAKRLAKEGNLLKLWKTDSNNATWGIWWADSQNKIELVIKSLPLYIYMKTQIYELTEHPNDPKFGILRLPL